MQEVGGANKQEKERMDQLKRLIDIFTLKACSEKRNLDELERQNLVCGAKVSSSASFFKIK